MKRTTFRVYSDPGHAWVKVPKLILDVYLGPDWRRHFTCFSYEHREHVYLEEDLDAATFDKRIRAAGIEPIYKEGSTCAKRYSRVRTYPALSPLNPSSNS